MVLVGIGVFVSQVIFFWKTVSALAHETFEILSDRQLKKLTHHKYKRDGDCTLLEPYLQPFWEWVVEKCPLWWAPNSITFVGLVINILTSLPICYFNPNGTGTLRNVPLGGASFGLFIYQTLDAIDGKQARRTASASPLGELFDHGCDAVSTVVLVVAAVIHLRYSPEMIMLMVLGSYSAFYMAHWRTYCTGALQFDKFDVIELHMMMIGGFFTSAILGEDVWLTQVPGTGLPVNFILSLVITLAGLKYYLSILYTIFVVGGVGKNGSTVADTSVLFPVFPLATFIILTVMIAFKSGTVFHENPCLYLFLFGMVFAKMTCKIIVAHMTKSELLYWDSVYVGPALLFLNQYFDFFFPEYYVLCISFIYAVLNLLHYAKAVSTQICNYMNIYCFSLRKPTPRSPPSLLSKSHSHSHNDATTSYSSTGRITRLSTKRKGQ